MKRCSAILQQVYKTERGRWITGAVFAVLLYLLAVLLQPVITFYDNDDLNIAWALAGYRSGTPSFSHPFINCITAFIVSALYQAFPAVPWWYAVQTVCLVLSVMCVAACTLRICAKRGFSVLVPLVLLAVMCAGMFYYAIAQVMFTLTSTSLGMAAVAMVLAADDAEEKRAYAGYLTGSVLLLALSFLIRQSSGLCAACFWAASMLYRFVKARRAKAPACRIVITAVAACALVACLTAVNGWGRENQNAPDFMAFEDARASYMDYPHDLHYENRALYESIGWDETLQGLVDAWFYMDARINAETFQIAADGSAFANLSFSARVSYAWESAGIFLGKYPIAVYLTAILIGAFLALAGTCLYTRRYVELLAGCCMLAGAAALLGFLFYSGRMNLRAWMSIAFPAITALLLLAATGGEALAAARARKKIWGIYALSGALAVASVFCAYKIFRTVVSYDSVDTLATTRAVADYAIAHPGNVYIRDVYAANNFDALTVYPEQKPTNLIDWGGCDTKTRAREAQWRRNGYAAAPDASAFLDGNVRYICNPYDRFLPLLYAYMQGNYGVTAYAITDWIADDVAVVQFVR